MPFHAGWSRSFSIALIAAAALSCGGDDLLLPAEGGPAQIVIVRGDQQRGTAGQPLVDSLVVRVTDAQRRPIASERVAFVPAAPGAAAAPDTAITDADGRAASRVALGTAAGTQSIEARVVMATQPQLTATFTASAEPTTAGSMAVVRGQEQAGVVEMPLPDSLVVRVSDQFGNAVSGVSVRWSAAGGGGVSPTTVSTGADGLAATQRTLGLEPGSYPTTAAVEGLAGSPARFSAMALPGAKPQLALTVAPPSTARNGQPLNPAPVIQLQSALGTPLPRDGVSITAAMAGGSGTLGGTVASRTDANGRASFGNLRFFGPQGARELIFAADGYTAVRSQSITVSAPEPSRSQSTLAVEPTSIEASTGASVATATATVRDAAGNPIQGASITVTTTNFDDLIIVDDPQTNASGVARARIASTTAGTTTVTVSASGVVLDQHPVITIRPGPPSASATSAEVPATARPFTPVVITIRTRDAYGNAQATGGAAIQVLQSREGGVRQAVPTSDNGDGTYTATFPPSFPGTYTIEITLNGDPIEGSPYQTNVTVF